MMHRTALLAFALVSLSACAPSGPRRIELRVFSDEFAFRISTDPSPPYAREPIIYRVVVRDKKTGEPIELGEGRIFAENQDGIRSWDSLVPAPESGTYTAKLQFLTAGDWALGIQFRRDSTQILERGDWRQTVRNERP